MITAIFVITLLFFLFFVLTCMAYSGDSGEGVVFFGVLAFLMAIAGGVLNIINFAIS